MWRASPMGQGGSSFLFSFSGSSHMATLLPLKCTTLVISCQPRARGGFSSRSSAPGQWPLPWLRSNDSRPPCASSRRLCVCGPICSPPRPGKRNGPRKRRPSIQTQTADQRALIRGSWRQARDCPPCYDCTVQPPLWPAAPCPQTSSSVSASARSSTVETVRHITAPELAAAMGCLDWHTAAWTSVGGGRQTGPMAGPRGHGLASPGALVHPSPYKSHQERPGRR